MRYLFSIKSDPRSCHENHIDYCCRRRAGHTLLAGGETPANPDARAYFVNLKDGDTESSPVTISFGLTGMGVAPAGTNSS